MTNPDLNYQGYYYAEGYSTDPILEGATRDIYLLFREDGIIHDYGDHLDDHMDSWGFNLILEVNEFYTAKKSEIDIGGPIGNYTRKFINSELHVKAIFPDLYNIWNKVGLGRLSYESMHFKVGENCLLDGVVNVCRPMPCGDGEYKQGRYQYFFDRAEWKPTIL